MKDVAAGVGVHEVTEGMKNSLNDQFKRFGVEIVDVMITDVKLPPMFVNQMQEKTTYITVIAEQRMKQQFDMQALRYKEEVDTVQQAKREEQEAEKANGERMRADISKELNNIQAETRKQVAELQQRLRSETLQVKSEGELAVAKVKAQKNLKLTQLDANARAQSEAVTAAADAYVVQKDSEAEMTTAQHEARAAEILADAEGQAASKVRSRRLVDLQKKQLEVFTSLSENKSLCLSGRGSDTLLADMLVAQRQSQVLLNVNAGAGPSSARRQGSSSGL